MKTNRSSADLAARITAAASQPVPLPPTQVATSVAIPNAAPTHQTSDPELSAQLEPAAPRPAPPARASKKKVQSVAITLRPPKSLFKRYLDAAADRTRKVGRVVSAQEIMLEQLEHGPS